MIALGLFGVFYMNSKNPPSAKTVPENTTEITNTKNTTQKTIQTKQVKQVNDFWIDSIISSLKLLQK